MKEYKQKKNVDVVLINGMTGDMEEHIMTQDVQFNFMKEIRRLLFDDFMKKFPEEEDEGRRFTLVSPVSVKELIEKEFDLFFDCIPLKPVEKTSKVLMFVDDNGHNRKDMWKTQQMLSNGEILYGSMLLVNLLNEQSGGIYGDLYIDKERYITDED
tara:strand:+ start:3046 stop:3513 length:468 start_codon:yes stop_codon:yes gene_type:complete